MATAFNVVDYRTVEPVRRPRLRIVEPMAAGAAVEAVQAPAVVPVVAPVAAVVAESAPAEDRKPKPPSWMVAPPFLGDPVLNVHESWTANRPVTVAPVSPVDGPYRSVRDVPRVDR